MDTELSSTASSFISLDELLVLQWILFAFCVLAFTIRVYIRYVCFHRILPEDWLMLLALACHLSIALLGVFCLRYLYELTAAEQGGAIGPNLFSHALKGLKAFGSVSVISLTGIWLIKINFLLFFYRLIHQIKNYRMYWWFVLIFSIGCGAGCFGLLQYPCMFGNMETIFVKCNEFSNLKRTYTHVIMTCVLDVLSDAAILSFPISILWRVKITVRQKLLLSMVFGLVGFTLAVTIVRGSIFGGVYKSIQEGNNNQPNITWIWFWFYVEFTISYIIACVVSFRTLFIHNAQRLKAKAIQQQRPDASSERKHWVQERVRRLHKTILDTCRTWEGAWDDSSSETLVLQTYRQPQNPTRTFPTSPSGHNNDVDNHDLSIQRQLSVDSLLLIEEMDNEETSVGDPAACYMREPSDLEKQASEQV